MIVDGRLATVVVPREDLEAARDPEKAEYLTCAVVDYVNRIQDAGVYTRRELPAVVMQAYHADYYLAQVYNGGHSQFIGNTGMEMLPTTSGDALAGLKAMGANAQYQILQEMIAWVDEHPEDAACQAYDVRAAALDPLDDRFYEAQRQQPMTRLAALWIASWPELYTVSREQYPSEIERLAQLHPHLPQRRIWLSLRRISYQMTDRLQLTVAAACGAVRPDPELKRVVYPGSGMDVEGAQGIVFGVRTNKGSRLCVYEEAGGQLYEADPVSQSPKRSEMHEILKIFPSSRVGERLSTVEAGTIRSFSQVAEQNLAAAAIGLLLRKLGLDTDADITALSVSDDQATWCAFTEGTGVLIQTLGDRANVLKPGGETMLTVTRTEIEQHAAEAAVGRDSLKNWQ